MIQEAATAAGGSIVPGMAAVGVGSSLINSMLTGIANRRANKRMVDFWRMNNAYNHPSEQMARLRDAGLNPHLMYGQGVSGATGMSDSSPKPVPETSLSVGDPAGVIMGARLHKLQSDNLRAQNSVLLNDATLKAANALKAVMDTKIKGVDLTRMQRTLEDSILKIQQDANYSMNRAEMQWQLLDRTRLTTSQRAVLSQENYRSLLESYAIGSEKLNNEQKLGRLRDLEITLKEKGIDFYDANAILSLLGKLMGLAPK